MLGFQHTVACNDYLNRRAPRGASTRDPREMSSKHDDAAHDALFVRNFALVLAGLTVFGIAFVVLARMVDSHFVASTGIREEHMEARLAPVGQINNSGEVVTLVGTAPNAGSTAEATSGSTQVLAVAASPGEAAYNSICFTCHAQGIAGAPKLGDATLWAPRIAQGKEILYRHSIEGFTGQTGVMPPKGGGVNLSDDDVKAAVDFMIDALNQAVNGSAKADDEVAAPAAVTDPAAAAPAAALEPAVAEVHNGKEVYDAICFACHTTGAAGAPKLGDAAAWSPRVAKGMAVLYDHSINGFMGETGLMPPKGGRPDFEDAAIRAAVDYLISNSQ